MDIGGVEAVRSTVDTLHTTLEHLVKLLADRTAAELDRTEVVETIAEVERFRNRLPLVDHLLLAEAARTDLADQLCQPNLTRMLTSLLRISPAEAGRRVRAAEQLGERTTMLGQPLDPVRPHLAAAQRDGGISAEKIDIVTRALGKVDGGGFDPDQIDWAEEKLAEYAVDFGPQELRRLAERVVDGINPDGTLPDDRLQSDRRFFHLRQASDGSYAGEFRLTGTAGAKLQTLLEPLARPRVSTTETEDGRRIEDGDPRTRGQRMHDALEDVCDRLLRSGDAVPDSGGTPATVIVTIDLTDLLQRTGYGIAADGTLIPSEKIRQLGDQANVYWAVVDSKGIPLRMGRERRIATPGQTAALIARDKGCSFPGCETAPDWCERHHVIAWIDGGCTDLDNLTLLCRYHHHNFLARGWECTINGDGLPEWRPPRWVDPARKPMINSRIRSMIAAVRRRQ